MFVGLCWAIHTSPSPAAWRRGDSNHHHHLQRFGAPKHVFARNPGRLNRLCVFFLDRAAESRHLKWCFESSLCLQRGAGRNMETPEPVTSLSLLRAGARLCGLAGRPSPLQRAQLGGCGGEGRLCCFVWKGHGERRGFRRRLLQRTGGAGAARQRGQRLPPVPAELCRGHHWPRASGSRAGPGRWVLLLRVAWVGLNIP